MSFQVCLMLQSLWKCRILLLFIFFFFFCHFKVCFLLFQFQIRRDVNIFPSQSQAILQRCFSELPFHSPHSLCISRFSWSLKQPLGHSSSEEMAQIAGWSIATAHFTASVAQSHPAPSHLSFYKHLKLLHWRKTLAIFQICILCVWPRQSHCKRSLWPCRERILSPRSKNAAEFFHL